jgi:ABC-type phosphate transport system substrate-binding protein
VVRFRGSPYDDNEGDRAARSIPSLGRTMFSRRSLLLGLACLACLPLSCSLGPIEPMLQGSGATFPAPLYKRWFLEFYKRHPDVRINYQPIGSGAGIRQFIEGLTHFGASDAAMSDKELEQAERARGAPVLMLPMTAGNVALCYNVPALKESGKTLKLKRKALIEILLGRVTEWNDPLLVKDNPDLADYDRAITWVRRSEGSGTTFAFTNHAGAISKEAIKMVPRCMREAAVGMGCTRTQSTLLVVVPAATTGILTGVMLAVARAAGETAPLPDGSLRFLLDEVKVLVRRVPPATAEREVARA